MGPADSYADENALKADPDRKQNLLTVPTLEGIGPTSFSNFQTNF